MENKRLLSPFLSILLCCILFFSCQNKNKLTDIEQQWLKQNDSLTIAMFPYYPPYQFINSDNDIVGFFIEYTELIEEKINYKFQRKYYATWPNLMADVRKGKIDLVLHIQATNSRKTYLNFVTELFESQHIIATRKDTFYGEKIPDFKHKKIIVPRDYAIAEILRQHYPDQTFIEDKDDLTCLQKLNSGIYDAYIGPKAVVNYLISNKNLDNIKIVAATDFKYIPGIAIDKNNKTLNSIIKKGIENISDAEYKNRIENWLYAKTRPFYKKSNFVIPIVTTTLITLICIVLINFYLGYMVKQKTKELKKIKDIAEKDNQLKIAFLSNISQEIKTPMHGIMSFSKLLNTPKLTKPEKAKYTNIIINSGKQLIDAIDTILEVSRLQTRQVKLNEQETNLNDVLETIHSIFEVSIREKEISLILNNNLKNDQHFVILDQSKFIKTINGIVENAIKHTKKGAILISCMVQNQTLVVSIKDSGIRTGDTGLNVIFKSFSKSKNYEGLELGLKIAKENTILMGGILSFSSIPHEGSTFRIELPYRPVDTKKISNTASTNSNQVKKKHYTILIAEDGEINFLFLKMLLKKPKEYDFTIHRVNNGKDAVLFCKKNKKIDLIFMDIKMPEMNGYDATRLIKKIRPELPIVAQTAYSTKKDIQKALRVGCQDFISKPIHYKDLKRILNNCLPISSQNTT